MRYDQSIPYFGSEFIGRLAFEICIKSFGIRPDDFYVLDAAVACAKNEYSVGQTDNDWLAATIESVKLDLHLQETH